MFCITAYYVFHVQPEEGHYQVPKHVVVPDVENALYCTNKYSCVRRVHTVYISCEIMWNANLMQQGNFIDVYLAHSTIRTVNTRPTQRLSRPPPIQKLGAENHTLQLNI